MMTVSVRSFWGRVTAFLGKALAVIVALAVLAGIGLSVFWLGWVSFVDKHELGYAYNRFSGQIEKVDRTGYIIRMPIKYAVHTIDLRPYQLSITADFAGGRGSSGIPARILNAKLVKFNPVGLETFILWHGREAGDSLDNLKEIMKCYAFDKEGGKDCPFIEVLAEINSSQAQTLSPSAAKSVK